MKQKVQIKWRREVTEHIVHPDGRGFSNLHKKDADGHFMYETTTHEVEVEVDVQKVAEYLGIKALKSKGRKAKEIGGLVVVKVLS